MIRLLLLYAFLCLTLTGCPGGGEQFSIEPAFITSKMHVPLFNKASQMQVEASLNKSLSFATGYTINDFACLLGSFSFPLASGDTSTIGQKRSYFFDVGGGYFYKSDGDLRLETFVRVGKGYFDFADRWAPYVGAFSYTYLKYAGQINAGFEWQNWVLAGSIRSGYMQMKHIKRDIKLLDQDSVVTNANIASQGSTFFNYGFTIRYESRENFGVELQLLFGAMKEVIGFASTRFGSEPHNTMALGLTYKF